jgi:antitoxin PrlF
VLGSFLDFLARDIATHPQHVWAIDARLVKRMRTLVKDAKVNLEAALDPVDE